MDWEAFCPSIINFTMPRNQNFLQVFETTYNLFSAEWAALGKEATKLHCEYDCARAQLEREDFSVQQNANIQLQELQNQMAHIYQEVSPAKMQRPRRRINCKKRKRNWQHPAHNLTKRWRNCGRCAISILRRSLN
ncbi:uncharacterized protein TM35_000025460 [Trypanosoma theileri]|uniref:Uncharacterized protein n=1 Tax=Trypanosoma theileri TaxID=67003 RepID=A0A1X0P9T7_9TRYP|nr:uncharacterized protein TM35_000025460 [Trypanosoma theileri]ORC93220.1 hypothetical protein TM35_000025460 [Trypanosoma theileri]